MENDFCIKLTEQNRATVKKWMKDDTYLYDLGAHYGIKDGQKFGRKDSDCVEVLDFKEFIYKILSREELDEVFEVGATVVILDRQNQDVIGTILELDDCGELFKVSLPDDDWQWCDMVAITSNRERKFKKGPIVIKTINKGRVDKYETEVPSRYITHGSAIVKEGSISEIVDFYEEYYIVRFKDPQGDIVQLAFKEEWLKEYIARPNIASMEDIYLKAKIDYPIGSKVRCLLHSEYEVGSHQHGKLAIQGKQIWFASPGDVGILVYAGGKWAEKVKTEPWVPRLHDWVVITRGTSCWNDMGEMDKYVGRTVQVTKVYDETIINFHDDGGWVWNLVNNHFRKATDSEEVSAILLEEPPNTEGVVIRPPQVVTGAAGTDYWMKPTIIKPFKEKFDVNPCKEEFIAIPLEDLPMDWQITCRPKIDQGLNVNNPTYLIQTAKSLI